MYEAKRNAEPRKCPAEFQIRLTRMFGSNRFHEPNFKFGWCQTTRLRMGNKWRENGIERKGYRECYQSFGMPCWTILQWKPPEFYGTPETYYETQFDAYSGLFTCGEFPWKGRYESIMPLYDQRLVNGKLEIQHFELTHILVDKVLPIIREVQQMSLETRKRAFQAIAEREEKEKLREIERAANEHLPVWLDAVSYSKQGIRTSRLTREMDKIEKAWKRLCRGGRRPRLQPGFAQGNRPLGRLI